MFTILQTCMYIYSQQHLIILLCAPIHSVVTKKNRKKYYCYWISYNNVINESYIFVYINCVKLRDQTKYSLLCIVRECIISTNQAACFIKHDIL